MNGEARGKNPATAVSGGPVVVQFRVKSRPGMTVSAATGGETYGANPDRNFTTHRQFCGGVSRLPNAFLNAESLGKERGETCVPPR
ncbi:hypothetical protein [Hyphococcus sp.]|uniref:hypothetical protein n=1 Tax=Hyphococcus sp. TaxID=2038636 RepID=UPI003CCBD21B